MSSLQSTKPLLPAKRVPLIRKGNFYVYQFDWDDETHLGLVHHVAFFIGHNTCPDVAGATSSLSENGRYVCRYCSAVSSKKTAVFLSDALEMIRSGLHEAPTRLP